MTFTLAWLRIEISRRWRSLAVLVLLIAVSAGVVMTALAAARRGASALTRLQHRTLPATVDVLANTPGFDWTPVAALPEVAALSKFVVDYQMALVGAPGANLGFPPADSLYLRSLEHPVILAGRELDPARADEAVVTRRFAANYHKGVGSSVVLELPSARQLAASFTGQTLTRYDGPRLRLHIVGVVVSPWLSDEPDAPGGLQISPGVVARYPLETVGRQGPGNTQYVNALVRLRRGERDVARFRDDLARVTGRADILVGDLVREQAGIQHHIAFQSRCLVAFAAAALLAAMFLVGQAIARYVASSTTELQRLRPSGLTRTQSMATAATAPCLAAVAGSVMAGIGAYLVSAAFPFGTAAYFEPDPGRSLDATVVGLGALAAVLLVGMSALGTALLSVRVRGREMTPTSLIASRVSRSAMPLPVIIGTRFALESGRGRSAVPVRPALVGSVVGVLGTVAAFTFAHGVSDAAHDPERFGQTFQLTVFLGLDGNDFAPSRQLRTALLRNSDVTGLADARTAVATNPAGTSSISLWEFQRRPEPLPVVLFAGRLPQRADEVALGPRTLRDAHVHVGGRIVLSGDRRGTTRTMTIVGSALVPSGPHNDYFDGGWVTSAGYDALFTGFKFHLQLIRVRQGLDPRREAARLSKYLDAALHTKGIDVEVPDLPVEASLIRQVERLPIFLGAFLALLAVAAVGHALASAVRHRGHDLAVLRALGMMRGQCRLVVLTQATVLALVGVVFGMPLGVALGRTVWRVVADYTPIQYVPPLDVTVLALVGPAAVGVANVLAAWPARRAARLRVAHLLRTE